MAQSTFSIRMDEGLKIQFDALCSDFGMSMSTAINVFAKAVVRERRIPFEITAGTGDITRESALSDFAALRADARARGLSGMTDDEINDEIRKARHPEEDK